MHGRTTIKILLWGRKFHWDTTRIAGNLHEGLTTFIIPRRVLMRMRNVSDKICGQNQNTYFVFSNVSVENRAVYEIMWKNVLELGGPQMTIWRTDIACSIPKATNTHLEYVILITFPLQKWLHERASMLCYSYIVCLVSHCCHVTSSTGRITSNLQSRTLYHTTEKVPWYC
jgi:hypothetical protein